MDVRRRRRSVEPRFGSGTGGAWPGQGRARREAAATRPATLVGIVAIAAGHDVNTVADRLGHANAAMTLRVYAHAFPKSDRAVADSVGAALEGKT